MNGQPRQRIVAYLGTIADLIYDGNHVWFWRAVTPRLDRLGRDAAEQVRIVAQLAVVVPQPIDTEWAEEACTTAERSAEPPPPGGTRHDAADAEEQTNKDGGARRGRGRGPTVIASGGGPPWAR